MSNDANAAQIAHWNDQAGRTWAEMNDATDRQIGPLGLVAIEALAPRLGERIVDIGCGCGQTSLQLAERVGAGGSVLGVDISQPMLEVARRRAAGVVQVAFTLGDAQTFAFEPGAADAAFSRFGVMFFADTGAAFTNIRKALKPGGRLGFVCWRAMAENPWMTVPLVAGLKHLPPPAPPNPTAPGPFALANSGRLRTLLEDAGFQAIDIRPHDALIGNGDLEQSVGFSLRVGPLGGLVRENPDKREAVAAAVREALAPYVGPDGGVRLPSAIWIVTAVA